MNTKELSKADKISEIFTCAREPIYFINEYTKIQHPVRGLIPFKTYDYQNDVIQAFLEHRFNIVLKARQLGFTTATAAFIAWFILFHKDKNVLIVSTKQEVAKTTIRIIRTILRSIPRNIMLCQIRVDNKTSIELSNGSRVKAITTASDAGRSEAASLLFIDEAAHIDKMDELWTGIGPTISTGGRAIIESTPNGTANLFYRLYKQAQNNENTFNCRFGTYTNPNGSETYNDRFMWWVHPEHNQDWFHEETKGKTRRATAQEYECNFNSSGDTFLPTETIHAVENNIKEPIERTYDDRNLWIWKNPEHCAIYIISADVSSGLAEDFTAFHVLRVDGKLEQVAEYRGKLPPDMLGLLLIRVSERYNNATIAPENNSGWAGQTILKITEVNYRFLYWSARNKDEFIDIYNTAGSSNAVPGYSVTPTNRIQMLSKMEQYVRNEDIVIHSSRLVDEFREFMWNNGRPQAARSAHDDLVMALAGGIWIRDLSFISAYRNADTAKALIAGMSTSNTPVTQFNSFNQSQPSQMEQLGMKNNVIQNSTADLYKWLITSG